MQERIAGVVAHLRRHHIGRADIAVLTGSGSAGLHTQGQLIDSIEYSDIPGFPEITNEGHEGVLYLSALHGKKILIFSGRFHYYEGYNMGEVVFPVRVAAALHTKKILMTNVSGSVNKKYKKGDLVWIRDHINLMPEHPLRGKNDPALGVRFPEMRNAYDPQIRKAAKKIMGRKYKEGVYVALQGPSLETTAEYEMIRRIGGDMVGMSTIPEVITARHAGMDTGVLSLISNHYADEEKTTIEAVLQLAEERRPEMNMVLSEIINKL